MEAIGDYVIVDALNAYSLFQLVHLSLGRSQVTLLMSPLFEHDVIAALFDEANSSGFGSLRARLKTTKDTFTAFSKVATDVLRIRRIVVGHVLAVRVVTFDVLHHLEVVWEVHLRVQVDVKDLTILRRHNHAALGILGAVVHAHVQYLGVDEFFGAPFEHTFVRALTLDGRLDLGLIAVFDRNAPC